MASPLYPISLNLENKLCVVIGGGKVAWRKIQRLLRSKARVKVISPQVVFQVSHYPNLKWVQGKYRGPGDLKGAALIFAATNDSDLNQQIQKDAHQLGIFINMASDSSTGDFITPATVAQGDLQLTISTSGKVPGLSKLIKQELEKKFTPDYDALISIFETVRQAALSSPCHQQENLASLQDMIYNYSALLNDLTKGTDPETITCQLLKNLNK